MHDQCEQRQHQRQREQLARLDAQVEREEGGQPAN